MSMEIRISIGDSLTDQAKVSLLNALWTQTQVVTAGDFKIRHDGDPGLSQRCNAEFDRYAAIRWQ